MRTTFLLAAIILTLAACASNTTEGNVASSDTGNLVCEQIAKTGSHMKRKRCITQEQSEAEKLAAQEYMRNNTTGRSSTSD